MTEPDAEDHRYFSAIETEFIRLRGAPLLLSPSDWQLARRWRAAGIPLEVVLESLAEVFEKRIERQKDRRVNGLSYCRQAVEASWRDLCEAGAGWVSGSSSTSSAPSPADPEPDASATLDVAARLEELCRSIPSRLADAEGWGQRIRGLSGDAQQVEMLLAKLQADLDRDVIGCLTPEELARMTAEVERALSAVREWSSPEQRDRELSRARGLWARRHLGAPRLSLFD